MLRDNLKKEIDKLNEEQLKKISDFIAFIEFQSRQTESLDPSTPAILHLRQALQLFAHKTLSNLNFLLSVMVRDKLMLLWDVIWEY